LGYISTCRLRTASTSGAGATWTRPFGDSGTRIRMEIGLILSSAKELRERIVAA
jgi:hypothetical protein